MEADPIDQIRAQVTWSTGWQPATCPNCQATLQVQVSHSSPIEDRKTHEIARYVRVCVAVCGNCGSMYSFNMFREA
jgi:RNase P subunit RPR2